MEDRLTTLVLRVGGEVEMDKRGQEKGRNYYRDLY